MPKKHKGKKGKSNSVLSTLLQNSNLQGGTAGILSTLQNTLGNTAGNLGTLQNTVGSTISTFKYSRRGSTEYRREFR